MSCWIESGGPESTSTKADFVNEQHVDLVESISDQCFAYEENNE
jgi:hypothetical protein